MELLGTNRVVYKIGSSESHAVLKNLVYIKNPEPFRSSVMRIPYTTLEGDNGGDVRC